jgi:putative membrane protein
MFMGFHPPGPPFGGDGPVFNVDHSWWAGGGWHILPFLMFLILMGVIVWAVIRLTPQKAHLGAASASPGSTNSDPALEEVRVRYARGEMTRDEFVQRFRDLGGAGLDAGPPDGTT